MPRGFATIDRRSFELAAFASCAVLAALGIWLLVRLVWLLVPRGDDVIEGTSMRVASGGGSVPAQSIAKWHLFGNTPAAAGSGPGAPATTLGMILRGTLADRDPAAGIAVIGDGERGERAYRAGDAIAGGVKLARVYPDHVVLLHEGVEETLTLTRDRNLTPDNIVRPPTPGDARNPSARNTPASIAAANAAAASAAAAQSAHAPADWQQTVDRLRQNPEELARRMQIVPVVDGGRLTGVRVAAGSDMTLINQVGLRAGDVVTAINGAPVDSIARGQQILESLRTASSARVTVLRDGRPTDVTIALK